MKILIIHNRYSIYGGEDKIVEQQYDIFAKNGIDVKLYCENSKDISSLSKFDKLRLVRNAYYSKKTEKDLLCLIKNFIPDIVHIHNVYPLISPIVYDFFKKRNIAVVQTLHNYRFICPNGLMFNNDSICEKCLKKDSFYQCVSNKCYHNSYIQSFWYSSIIGRAYSKGIFNSIEKFISLNEFVKEKMMQKGYDKEKIAIIPNCITESENNFFQLEKENYYLYIGRLSEEKGVNTLIKAFSVMKDTKLKIVGDGPLKDQVENCINESNLKNIELLGFKSGQEKCKLIAEAKALIVPSEWYENFPTVVLEAFSLGTFVIGSSIGGLQYMIEDNYNGIKFVCGDIEDLRKKIYLVDNDWQTIIKLSQNAYKTYKDKYTEKIYYDNHMKLYKSLIDGRYN